MKSELQRIRRGFTLLELTIAIMLGMATGSMVLALFNQQLTFLRIYKAQNFLTEEAPIISMYVSRLVGKADRFRLYATVGDAKNGTNARLTPSKALVMNFRQPDGTMRATILSFERNENHDNKLGLYYYIVPLDGALGDPQLLIDPQLLMTTAPSDVTFSMDLGVLRMILTGPAGEQITYSGTMQQ
jgi:hypothetical protein